MINYYNELFCLNVLAGSHENAEEIYKAAKKCALVGILSSNYLNDEDAILDMQQYSEELEGNLSIGLGGGNPKQADMVVRICKEVYANHINQVFTSVGQTRISSKNKNAHINSLVSPSGIVGKVVISTGPKSSKADKPAIVDIETAIAMIKDMGGNSIKFFPMKGLAYKEEYIEVAKQCAKHDFILEPTGGIDLSNIGEILEIAVSAGVKKIIPHVYTSIIDSKTGLTRIEDIKKIMDIFDTFK